MSVGTTYAIWSAAGTAAVALIGIAALRRGRLDAQARLARPYRAGRDRAQCRRRALEIALLDAASTVVQRDGAQALTLDAVAAEAEVSKGGLLYHFKSKRDLVEGMVDRWLAEFQREIDEADADFVRGYVKAERARGQRTRHARRARRGPFAAGRGAPSVRDLAGSRGTRSRAIRSTRPSPGWPPTGFGSPSCWVWDLRREPCASTFWSD